MFFTDAFIDQGKTLNYNLKGLGLYKSIEKLSLKCKQSNIDKTVF